VKERAQTPGARPNRDDVAKRAGTSGPTVSRVMSGRTDIPISEETRNRVLEAARALGYSPNPAATVLRTGKSGLVGFWMTLKYSRYRSQVADQMRQTLDPTGLAMAVTDADAEYCHHGSFSRVLRLAVDGIVAFDASGSVDAFARDADRLAPNIPFVSMGAYWSELKSFVGVDLQIGAEMAVEHLLSVGRRRIAYLAPKGSGLLTEGPRYEGYQTKMLEAGLEPIAIPVIRDSGDLVEDALIEYLRDHPPFDALVCVSDEWAIDTMVAVERLGMKPGEDVALIGFNGTEGIERGPCPLSTIAQPIEEMCRLAVEFLTAQMEDPRTPIQQRILRPALIVRKSTTGK
jgi:DNA-binding LacI/PurR family transcriptional regulator